ncbi:MAG: hypothetical protein MUQ48_02060, partial [Pirellulales bacterium]|nr:hypothetical protein [Pirellulales bacterium]
EFFFFDRILATALGLHLETSVAKSLSRSSVTLLCCLTEFTKVFKELSHAVSRSVLTIEKNSS